MYLYIYESFASAVLNVQNSTCTTCHSVFLYVNNEPCSCLVNVRHVGLLQCYDKAIYLADYSKTPRQYFSIMASFFIQSARKTLSSSSTFSKTLIHGATSAFFFQSRPYATELMTKSPFVANILRILRTEIQYQSEYAPPLPVIIFFFSLLVSFCSPINYFFNF